MTPIQCWWISATILVDFQPLRILNSLVYRAIVCVCGRKTTCPQNNQSEYLDVLLCPSERGKRMSAKFEMKHGGGQYMFNLKAANGEVILTSQMYKEKQGAVEGIASVKANASEDARFERKTAKNGQPFFVLKAANGETIGKSETYSS